MASQQFSVVLCHGSYHTPAPYQPLIDALTARGIDAYCPQRPSCDLSRLNVGDVHNPDFDREPPPGGYPTAEEDATEVGKLVDQLIAEGKSVLLAGHSSGGWVAAEAAQPARQAHVRAQAGHSGGIIGIFFIGAFIIPKGESVDSFFQPADGEPVAPPFVRFHKFGMDGLGIVVDAPRFFFNGVDDAAAQKWAATLTAAPIMTSPLTHDPYSTLPCAYLVLEQDCALPKGYQEGMVAMQSSKSKPFTIYRGPCGHSPHLSWTSGLVETIEEFRNGIA